MTGSDRAAAFRALHHGRAADDPLVLPGPWDAGSARVYADAGFPALATPSAGIAASLGYEDGATPPDEMFAAVARIVRAVAATGSGSGTGSGISGSPPPVSADIEDGYGLAPAELVARVLDTGAVGCNLEDSADGRLKDPYRHADWLAEVRAAAGDRLVVNARVDTFIRGVSDPAQAITRARLYVAAGADCVYPIGAPREAIPALRAGIEGPVNIGAAVGGVAELSELGRLGATRVTFGPGLQRQAMAAVREGAARLRG